MFKVSIVEFEQVNVHGNVKSKITKNDPHQ